MTEITLGKKLCRTVEDNIYIYIYIYPRGLTKSLAAS